MAQPWVRFHTPLIEPDRQDEALVQLNSHVETLKVGAATDLAVQIGPMVSQRQWERVQSYTNAGDSRDGRLCLERWALEAALSRRNFDELSSSDIQSIRGWTHDGDAVKWPRCFLDRD